jgi:hypothetical protein
MYSQEYILPLYLPHCEVRNSNLITAEINYLNRWPSARTPLRITRSGSGYELWEVLVNPVWNVRVPRNVGEALKEQHNGSFLCRAQIHLVSLFINEKTLEAELSHQRHIRMRTCKKDCTYLYVHDEFLLSEQTWTTLSLQDSIKLFHLLQMG